MSREGLVDARMPAVAVKVQGVGLVTKADLPVLGCRWTPKRKAIVAALIDAGIVALGDMAAKYAMSVEELTGWRDTFQKYGLPGMRVTRCQDYGGHVLRKRHD